MGECLCFNTCYIFSPKTINTNFVWVMVVKCLLTFYILPSMASSLELLHALWCSSLFHCLGFLVDRGYDLKRHLCRNDSSATTRRRPLYKSVAEFAASARPKTTFVSVSSFLSGIQYIKKRLDLWSLSSLALMLKIGCRNTRLTN